MPIKMNARWFQNQLETKQITQRKLAKALKVDPSAVSLMLHGKRKMHLDEAVEFAKLLGVPLDEVLANAGIKTSEVAGSAKSVKIIGWVDKNLSIHRETPKGVKSAPSPIVGGDKLSAVRFHTVGSKYEGLDGAVVYFEDRDTIHSDILGKMCLVKLNGSKTESKEWFFRVIRRGHIPGHYSLYSTTGELLEENVTLRSAAPVVWMRFG